MHTPESFKRFLEDLCDCSYDGRELSPPYRNQDDMPDIYRHPEGYFFQVPQPEGTHYPDWLVDKIMQTHNVVKLRPARVVKKDDSRKEKE